MSCNCPFELTYLGETQSPAVLARRVVEWANYEWHGAGGTGWAPLFARDHNDAESLKLLLAEISADMEIMHNGGYVSGTYRIEWTRGGTAVLCMYPDVPDYPCEECGYGYVPTAEALEWAASECES